MATPKIKVYRLERGYSQDTDNDVQGIVNDELLPIVDKNLIPTDAYVLYGVTDRTKDIEPVVADGSHAKETLLPINITKITEILTNSGGQVQGGSVGNWIVTGYYVPVLKYDTAQVIPTTKYTINAVTGEVTFVFPYPVGDVTAEYYTSIIGDTTDWYTPNYPLYGRSNYNFRERLFDSLDELYEDSEYTIDYTTGLITFPVAKSAPIMKFYQQTEYAKIFVSDNPNWVYGHLRTNPDIFQGMQDYAGDDYVPVSQGPIPKFIDSGFQIDYRNGSVVFTSGWDSSDLVNPSPLPVTDRKIRANYAYYKNIDNVTGQVLDLDETYIGGFKYKANTEKYFPNSHGKRWVTRENYLMPQNFYDGAGNAIPALLTTSPYAVLELVTLEYLSDYNILEIEI